MAEPYNGRVEYAASGSSRLEIDDLDAPNWIGTSSGPWVIGRSEPEVWEIGVILLDGPRAWQYATADRVVRHGDDDGVTISFEGKTAFAHTLSADDVRAAQQRVEVMRQRHAQMRVPLPPKGDALVFENPRLSILERPRRGSDEVPDLYSAERHWRPATSRLALDHGGTQLYVGEGSTDDSICLHHRELTGGGGCGFRRSVFASHGASISWSWGSGRSGVSVHGVVPDEVIAVRVNGHHAVMGENVFLIVLDHGAAPDEIILTTATGEHEIRFGPPPEL